MRIKNNRKISLAITLPVFALCALAALIYSGRLVPNRLFAAGYPVKGVDISAYQGTIDWKTLSAQGISFVFIKATEGSSFVDENFACNYDGARQTKLRVGAYHFFSYDSAGSTQADNFIETVARFEGMLPPVIDLEFYGDKRQNPPLQADVRRELDAFIEKVTEYYGMKPIIYATEKSYSLYLDGAYEDCDIWIRNVYMPPTLSDNRDWTFWQYTDKGLLDGYQGEEKYIDLNVFCGTEEEFSNYFQ
ncbi:MAG: glycoside hydrolase family 25 protein [Eubacterium sp.]|nr:glycoside hydrolase family 25 protein [Eubacterium sp.]MCM1216688.1 glycoside hydrolase family 25 protein [Lachnospiraceae bacterium]MCM1240388.1 glycoside hydrolase family 25 protein [Lachnospiraceae bacterium]